MTSKLDYAGHGGKVAAYANSYLDAGKIDAATHALLLQIEDLTNNSGVLIEFDTVINQLLVYLHLWNRNPGTPFYTRVLNLAQQQQLERSRG